MRACLGVCALLLALVSCQGYSSYRTSYRTSSSSSFGGGAGGGGGDVQSQALRSSWAYDHSTEVREFANRLTQQYNVISTGGSDGIRLPLPWSTTIQQLSGKSATELDAICLQISQKLVNDMRQGLISYNDIAQPTFFDTKAAEVLKSYDIHVGGGIGGIGGGLQQTVELNPFQPVDLSGFDEVKNYAYPTEVKVIDGKTYVVHRNCTEATKLTNTFGSNSAGQLTHGYYAQNPSSSIQSAGSSASLTSGMSHQSSLQDWIGHRMEPTVVDYRSVISIDGGHSLPSFGQMSPVPSFSQTKMPGASSTVTVRRFNKTITTHADGTSSVDGSESQQRWEDGQLVYDNKRPFGQSSVPRDDQWKREEREHFFWYLTTPQRLEDWQHQHEDRLLAVAHRYHTTLPILMEFHRRELARYQALLGQYQAQVQDASAWQRQERGRLDWLIHQNSFTSQDFERWQLENSAKLRKLAQTNGVSQEQLQQWQRQELQRLYIYFNKINDSLGPQIPHQMPIHDSGSLTLDNEQEQQRLNELIRQHNATIAQLQNSIFTDQQRLKDLSVKYQGDMQSQTQWLRGEVARIAALIKEQNEQVTKISAWQGSERARLESMLRQHRGSLTELQQQMAQDRSYVQNLAAKYRVGVDELEKWQREELQRLQLVGQQQLESHIKDWQVGVSAQLRNIIGQNQLTIEEFQSSIINDRARLEQFARTYKVRVDEIESWIRSELKKFQSEGLLKEVEQQLAAWQQRERERLQTLVQHNSLTVEQLEAKIKNDQTHFFDLANTYHVRVEDIQEWLKKELLRLQSEGLLKAEALKDWQVAERQQISQLVQQNKYSIDEFERKLLADRARLNDLSKTYNVQVSEIEHWIQSEGERLQREGQLHMETQLNTWQKIERQRLLDLINKNNLSIEELKTKIGNDQTHLYSLAQQNQVRVEEIEQWIKQQIQKLQSEGLIEMQRLQNWQQEWRGNLTNMVQERDYTVEEFHKWLLEDRARLESLAMQHNVQIEEIEQFVKKEEQRFVGMGLLKPSEKLTNWQEVERLHLKNLAQQQYKSTEQLEARLRQDRELLEKLARQYSVQVEDIESWMKQELARMRDEGKLQIDNLTSWQLAERERLETLLKQNKQWSAEELQAELRNDREHMQTMAFQYHTSVEDIERWVQTEIERLKQQGKLNIEQLTAWQKAEQQRILLLLQSQSNLTMEQFEAKVQNDRHFLLNLAEQHHVSIMEIETYIKQVIEDLQKKGQFEIEQLQTWQLVERDYIKSLIAEYKNGLSTAEYEQKLLADRSHLNQLADQYRLNVVQIEEWMISELKRLRGNTETSLKTLSAWQVTELERLQHLLKEQTHISYVEFELELQKERERLQKLGNQYSVNVEEIEQWLRQQLINLKTTGNAKVQNLSKWQIAEQERLIELLLKHQQDLNYEDVERELRKDHDRLESLSQTNHVSIGEVDNWLHDELQRLQSSGLVQFEQQTQWQKQISSGFDKWLKQQQDSTSYQEFVDFLQRDKARLSGIANDYHLTVEQVEQWVQKETARLSLIGVIEKPQQNYRFEEIVNISDQRGQTQPWKEYLTARLRSEALLKPMSWQEFNMYLIRNQANHERLAQQYHITVEEIHVWLQESAKQLANEGLITGTISVEEWQLKEQQYIQDLINQQLRRRQKWSIEELQLKLLNDQKHLLDVVRQYQITIEELKLWYKTELKRLLDQRKIERGLGLPWQTKELERIYQTVVRHPINRNALEQLLMRDAATLAVQYRITVEELRVFIHEKLQRLADMGLIVDGVIVGSDWKEQERQRLRQIGSSVLITDNELLELISLDNSFQGELARLYGVGLNQLAPVQRIHVANMAKEQLLEERRLNVLTSWQQKERDRLYDFIGTQNMTLRQLRDWQRQDEEKLQRFAQQYLISLHELKSWQLKEFERIMTVARYYGMSLTELQQFRENELQYLSYLNHRKLMPESAAQSWETKQHWRLQQLQTKYSKYGQELSVWRRIVYLLSQGLIDLPTNGNGGYVVDPGTTNATAVQKPIFSKDRGDQPPHVYEETYNEDDEPGLEGETKSPLPPVPMPIVSTPAPLPYQRNGPSGANGGYEYRRTDYTFNVPIGSASASASGGAGGSSASASAKLGKWSRAAGEEPQSQLEDLGQQQQVDLGWKDGQDDGGQQQQQQEEDFDWNANYKLDNDAGQQQQQLLDSQQDLGQQQVEDLAGQGYGHSYGSNYGQLQQAQPVETTTKASTFDKIKHKITDIFG